jgi:hypothetical protein
VTIGAEAGRLTYEAGVLPIVVLPRMFGSAVLVEDDLLLTAAHLVGETEGRWSVLGAVATPEVIADGGRTVFDDWILVRMPVPDFLRPCRLGRAAAVTPGQEALMVGFWNWRESTTIEPLAISGRVMRPPELFRPFVGDLACLDLGPQTDHFGMSGSPVLVRNPGSAIWEIGGVYAGRLSTDRGDAVEVFAPLTPGFDEWASLPGR